MLSAAILCLLWIMRADTYPAPLMDQGFYDEMARRIAGGLGYTTSDGVPTAIFPPGYPFLLAGGYRLFGADLAVAQALNVAISLGIVLATYTLGRLFANRNVALRGAWLVVPLPSQVLWSALVMSELPFTLALLASVGLFARGLGRGTNQPSTALLLLAGLCGGYAALTRGQAVGLPLVLLGWALWLRQPGAGRATALFTSTFVLVLLPWVVRNSVQIDRSVLLSSNGGWNAVIGHHDQADGGFWSPLYGNVFDPYLTLPPAEREIAMHREGLRMARQWAARNPAREAKLTFLKVRRLWAPSADAVRWQEPAGVRPFMRTWERSALTWASYGAYTGLLALALPAVVLGARQREPLALLVLILAGYWTAFHVLFFAEGRYVYPLLPLFCLLAAITLSRVPTAARALRQRRDAPGIAA